MVVAVVELLLKTEHANSALLRKYDVKELFCCEDF